jgi:hypothetical protein
MGWYLIRYESTTMLTRHSCYNVPAIDARGSVAQGLPHSFVSTSENCRSRSDLENNNVYSRQRCNNGWCVYLYDYYFEKDVAIPYFADIGHTHDWEHIAVWVRAGAAEFVAASQHGKYEIRKAADVRWDGTHPKLVYHKDGSLTHAMRFASAADDAVENHLGVWFRGSLISYNGFPEGVRDLLYRHNFGEASVALTDSSFPGNLGRARPGGILFDVNVDEGSPGIP